MVDILITGGTIITMDPGRRVLEDGAVAITGDRIVAVGPSAEIAAAHPAPRVIDARRQAVLPGLIDAHAHAGHGLVKTIGGGDSDVWTEAVGHIYREGTTPSTWAAEARLAALERLKCGVTTGVSLLGGGDSTMRSDDPASAEAHVAGVGDIGIRAIVAVGVSRPPFPQTYTDWDGGTRRDKAITFERMLEVTERLIERCHGAQGGRIRIAGLAPVERPAAGDAPDPLAVAQSQRVRELTRAKGVLFHQDGHRGGSIALARQTGLLGADAFLSHCVDLTEADMDALAETGTRVAHNPSAVMSIRGRCPAPELIDRGVIVMLGSDATAPDRGADMFRHMWQCMHYHRRHFRDARIMPPGKVLEMCTIDAARGLGIDHEVGSLEPGKKADVILVNLFAPHMVPLHMPVYRVVCFANGADVTTAICDGVVRMEHRRLVGIDETAILEDAHQEAEAMLARTGRAGALAMPVGFWGATRY